MIKRIGTYETAVDCGTFGELDIIVHYTYEPARRSPNSIDPEEAAQVTVTKLEWPFESDNISFGWDSLSADDCEWITEEIQAIEENGAYDG